MRNMKGVRVIFKRVGGDQPGLASVHVSGQPCSHRGRAVGQALVGAVSEPAAVTVRQDVSHLTTPRYYTGCVPTDYITSLSRMCPPDNTKSP